MSPVEELREAARLLRAVAQSASPQWRVDVVGPLGAEIVLKSVDVATNLVRDAVYVHAMRPAVGLALAAWWDCVAIDEEQGEPETAPRIRERTAALRLARVYLGKSTEDGAR